MTEKLTPEDAAHLAVAVRKIAANVAELNAAGLSRRALVVLLDDFSDFVDLASRFGGHLAVPVRPSGDGLRDGEERPAVHHH